jgi:hypothetical protein
MTAITGGLITLEYAAEGLNFRDVGSSAQSVRDADLTAYVQAATPVIEDLVGPVLQVTKTVGFDGGGTVLVLPDRATSITSVVENGATLTAGSYMFDPIGSIVYGGNSIYPRVFYPGRLAIQITYVTGYPTVPATLQLAARELVRFWWQQGKAAQRPSYSDAVESTPPQGFAVPKRVIELCRPFQRSAVGFA